MQFIAGQDPQTAGCALLAAVCHVPELREALELLKPILSKTESFEHCTPHLEVALAQRDPESAFQFLLALVTALDLLPFEKQISFLEDVLGCHWEKVKGLLAKVEKRVP